MRIAFFTLSFDTQMYKSLINKFVNSGHEVVVVTPVYSGRSHIKVESGCKVLYFRTLKVLDVDPLRKGIGNLLLSNICIHNIKKLLGEQKFDLILLTTPTLMFYKAIKYLKFRSGSAFFYLILRDIHPEGIGHFGVMKIRFVWNYFRRIEKRLYNISDKIGCMSPGNIEFIAHRNPDIDTAKLTLLPNWEDVKPYNLDLSIRKKYNLNGKYVLIYGGNIGAPQGLDVIMYLAAEKIQYKDVLFLFLGKGNELKNLKRLSVDLKLTNVIFMDFIPRQDYDCLMKACDVGIISLSANSRIPCIPSKALGYFNSKLPILANLDEVTDFNKYIIDRIGCGLWSLTSEFHKLSANFDKLYHNKELRIKMGENGYKFLEMEFNVELIYNKILTDLEL